MIQTKGQLSLSPFALLAWPPSSPRRESSQGPPEADDDQEEGSGEGGWGKGEEGRADVAGWEFAGGRDFLFNT
jgi:hypothetical protein